jgi:hypothetical protein
VAVKWLIAVFAAYTSFWIHINWFVHL